MSPPGDDHPELRYEQSDVRAGAIVRFALGLVTVVAVSAVLLLGLFKLFARQQRRHDPPPPPLAREAGRLPPAPRLQASPLQDLEQVRAEEEKELSSYGWVDPKAGIVHIPIDEAIKTVAARGLPRAAPAPSPSTAPSPPGSPGPGRRR
jgi:hypothetical protein